MTQGRQLRRESATHTKHIQAQATPEPDRGAGLVTTPPAPVGLKDLRRLRSDFRVTLMVLLALVLALGVLPFAVYRLAIGQVAAGVVDLAIVAAVSWIAARVWRGSDVDRASLLVMGAYTAGCVLVAYWSGRTGLQWLYAVVMANYLIATPRAALVGSLVGMAAVVGVALHTGALRWGEDAVISLVSLAVVNLFAFIFAWRNEYHLRCLEEVASLDPLTGAYNRRMMERELEIALEARRRSGAQFGLAVLDLDHFKSINDQLGHEAGDAVLVEFANQVRGMVRRGDRFFRYGGEEFVLLLAGVDEAGLLNACEKVRVAVAAQLRAGELPVTLSIGAALPAGADDSGQAWFSRADAALYRAKHQGRDCVVLAE